MASGPNSVALCQEVEAELRELCLECRKKFPIIKEYTERAINKVRQYRDAVELETRQHRNTAELDAALGRLSHEFPQDEVFRSIQMACETFQTRVVLGSLLCLQRLINRRILKDEMVPNVINLMKEQAMNGDETVQVKVLQTIMATPSHMTLLNEHVVEQLMQLLYVLHNSPSADVHNTACAGLRQVAEGLSDRAATAAKEAGLLHNVLDPATLPRPVIQVGNAPFPQLTPAQPPSNLDGQVKMLYIFVQDLCVMADYDASSLSTRYSMDAGDRMRYGCREGFWLSGVKFPRPLCLELLRTCVEAHPQVFVSVPELFSLLRLGICPVLLKNLRGCFDFAILIRSIQVLQQVLKSQQMAALLVHEFQVFLHLMLDFTTAERSPWQRATALEFLKFMCEQTGILPLLYHSGDSRPTSPSSTDPGPRTFIELVNNLSKLMHQVCFSSGMDSSTLLQSATGAGALVSFNLQENAGTNSRSSIATVRESSGRTGQGTGRLKLLQLMNEAEPPQVNPSVIVSLLVESLFAIVSTLYRLLQDADEDPSLLFEDASDGSARIGRASSIAQLQRPIVGQLGVEQERCRGMLVDCWASLLSALSLVLHSSSDEALLQQALRSLRTLLYCCGRMSLDQARDTCLLQLSRYALPGHSHDGEAELPINSSTSAAVGMTAKNILCFRALLNICQSFGMLLGVPGWTIALRAFDTLERTLQRVQTSQLNPSHELAVLQKALESLFETAVLLPLDCHSDIVDAMGEYLLKNEDLNNDGSAVLSRLTELCTYDAGRLALLWERILGVILSLCTADVRPELRGTAASALCKILSQALRKGALATVENPEVVQGDLLRPLEVLLHATHEDVRTRVCEGLLQILQASGQELQVIAWATTIDLVAVAAQVELERAGLRFYLPRSLDHFSPEPSAGSGGGAEEVFKAPAAGAPSGADGRDNSMVLPVVFQLLELLVHDFMEYVPTSAVPRLTASIGAFARFNGLGVNSSLTAVGFLWNVADALARYQCSTPMAPTFDVKPDSKPSEEAASGDESVATNSVPGRGGMALVSSPEELWIQIFMHLRTLAVDSRPEVRNCAVKSLTSALLSHGRKVGPSCYRRCLEEILIQVLAEMEAVISKARNGGRTLATHGASEGLIVHHSRDTLEKQWAETLVLGLDGARRVLSHFSEESGPAAFAPLAYALLLQLQTTLRTLSPEVSPSALKALIDLMRIPSSSLPFCTDVINSNEALPVKAGSTTSVWALGWRALWRLAQFAMTHRLPEPLMEAFAPTLTSLRASRASLTPCQHLILNQLILAMATAPTFVLSLGAPIQPLQAQPGSKEREDAQGLRTALSTAVLAVAKECSTHTVGREASMSLEEENEVFDFVPASADDLWNMPSRCRDSSPAYAKAPVQSYAIIEENPNRNVDVRSMEWALQAPDVEVYGGDDSLLGFLGPTKTPTFRTMLHSSSAKLSHAQGFIFSALEEMQIYQEPFLQVLVFYQLCAVFLDVRRVMVDTNRVALAVRMLVLLVLLTRRVLLFSFRGVVSGRASMAGSEGSQSAAAPAEAHAEALIEAMPQLLRVVTALIQQPGPREHRKCGLWKVALEALVYLIEDSIPAVERVKLDPRTRDAYWTAVADSLREACDVAASGQSEILLEVVGNLVVHRILASSATPPAVAERLVLLLVDLVAGQGAETDDVGNSEKELSYTFALGHLFELLSCEKSSEGAEAEVFNHSVVAITVQRLPKVRPHLLDRTRTLGMILPVVLAKVKRVLRCFAEESARGAPSPKRAQKVLFILSRIKALHVDGAEFAEAVSSSAALNEAARASSLLVRPVSTQGREACRLAGPQGFAMALLPDLAGLISCSDANIRQEVQETLQGLAHKLGV